MKNLKTTLSDRRNSIKSSGLLYRKTDLSIKGGIWKEVMLCREYMMFVLQNARSLNRAEKRT